MHVVKKPSFHKFTNDELMDYVIEHCDDQEAALALRDRWKDFWVHVRQRFANHPYVEPDWLLEYDRKLKQKLSLMSQRDNHILDLDEKIRQRQEEIAKLDYSDWYRLKRRMYTANGKFTKAKRKIEDLRRIIRKATERIHYLEHHKREFLSHEHLVAKVQNRLIRENLQRLDRHMHRLALVEAGLIDASLTLPAKNEPVE